MITPNSSEGGEQDHGFQIAPMVDVVFVLLLFFMALAGLRQIEEAVPVKLPASSGGDDAVFVVDVTGAGAVLCNGLEFRRTGEMVSSEFDAWLKNVAKFEPNATVLIRAEGNAEHGVFIQVLTSLHRAGLKKITFS